MVKNGSSFCPDDCKLNICADAAIVNTTAQFAEVAGTCMVAEIKTLCGCAAATAADLAALGTPGRGLHCPLLTTT
jgi:hypothetical protein